MVTSIAMPPANEAGDNWEYLPWAADMLALRDKFLLRYTWTAFESFGFLMMPVRSVVVTEPPPRGATGRGGHRMPLNKDHTEEEHCVI